jgi:hypothetical protein
VVAVSLPLGLGGGGFAFTTVQDVLWATGLAMIADAARPSRTSVTGVGAGIGSAVAVVAALCALVMLGTAPAWPRPG